MMEKLEQGRQMMGNGGNMGVTVGQVAGSGLSKYMAGEKSRHAN